MTDEKLRRILDDKKLRMMLKEASPQQEIARLRAEIARLRLTDEEREAVDVGAHAVAQLYVGPEGVATAATLRTLLERLR